MWVWLCAGVGVVGCVGVVVCWGGSSRVCGCGCVLGWE